MASYRVKFMRYILISATLAMGKVVSYRLLYAEAWDRLLESSSEICGGQNGSRTDFSSRTWFFLDSVLPPILRICLFFYCTPNATVSQQLRVLVTHLSTIFVCNFVPNNDVYTTATESTVYSIVLRNTVYSIVLRNTVYSIAM